MIRANRENREWENEAWDKQADKAGESREQAQEDPIQKRENGQTDITGKNGNHIELISIIGEIGDMKICPAIRKRRNMSIFCLSWRRSRRAVRRREF
ncbi:MAG: hypothetical protein ACLT76_05085 [Clostridium fessum]